MNEPPRLCYRGLLQIVLCAAMLLCLIVLDWRWFHRGVLSEGPPVFSIPYLLRSLAIAAAAWLGLRGCMGLFSGSGSMRPSTPSVWPGQRVGRAVTAGIPLMAAAVLTAVMCLDPRLFHEWVMEDGPVENLSALLAFAAGGVMARVWWLEHRRSGGHPLRSAYLLGFAVVCVLLAGEEVSWFQRQAGFETPAAFAGNAQKEFNLHNFETDRVETAYYLAAFGVAVCGAFLRENCAIVRSLPWLAGLLPGRYVAYAGAFGAGFNYEMWNTIPTQLKCFATVAILCRFAWHGRGRPGGAWLPLTVLLVFASGQVLSLALGHTMVRSWDGTEVKELFMPMSFLLYAMELHARHLPAQTS